MNFQKNQIFISQNDEINKKMESLKLIFEQEQLCSKIVSDNSRRHTLTRSLKDKFSSTHMNEMFQFKKGEHFFSLEGNQVKIIDILLEPESFRINKSSNLVFSKMVTVEFKRRNGAFDGKKVERRLNINVQAAVDVDAHGTASPSSPYIKGCQLATREFEDVAMCRYLGDASGIDLCNDLIREDASALGFENLVTEKMTFTTLTNGGRTVITAAGSDEIIMKKVEFSGSDSTGNQFEYTNLFIEGPLSDPNDPNSERLPIVVEGRAGDFGNGCGGY